MTFGERLRQLRTEKGLTQKQLAVETGTSERLPLRALGRPCTPLKRF